MDGGGWTWGRTRLLSISLKFTEEGCLFQWPFPGENLCRGNCLCKLHRHASKCICCCFPLKASLLFYEFQVKQLQESPECRRPRSVSGRGRASSGNPKDMRSQTMRSCSQTRSGQLNKSLQEVGFMTSLFSKS